MCADTDQTMPSTPAEKHSAVHSKLTNLEPALANVASVLSSIENLGHFYPENNANLSVAYALVGGFSPGVDADDKDENRSPLGGISSRKRNDSLSESMPDRWPNSVSSASTPRRQYALVTSTPLQNSTVRRQSTLVTSTPRQQSNVDVDIESVLESPRLQLDPRSENQQLGHIQKQNYYSHHQYHSNRKEPSNQSHRESHSKSKHVPFISSTPKSISRYNSVRQQQYECRGVFNGGIAGVSPSSSHRNSLHSPLPPFAEKHSYSVRKELFPPASIASVAGAFSSRRTTEKRGGLAAFSVEKLEVGNPSFTKLKEVTDRTSEVEKFACCDAERRGTPTSKESLERTGNELGNLDTQSPSESLASSFHRHRLLSSAFQSLRLFCAVQASDDFRLVSGFQLTLLRRYFSFWRRQLALRRLAQTRLTSGRRRISRLRVCFTAWKEYVAHQRNMRQVSSSSQHRLLTKTFQTWRQEAREQSIQRNISSQFMAELFRHWREKTRRKKSERTISNQRLSKAFQRWREGAKEKTIQKLILKRNGIKTKLIFFQEWRRTVLDRKKEAQCIVDRFRKRRHFLSWRFSWERNTAAEAFRLKQDSNAIRAAFLAWQSFVENSLERERKFEEMELMRLGNVFDRWRRKSEAKRKSRLGLCFSAWRRVTREIREAQIIRFSMLIYEKDAVGKGKQVLKQDLEDDTNSVEDELSKSIDICSSTIIGADLATGSPVRKSSTEAPDPILNSNSCPDLLQPPFSRHFRNASSRAESITSWSISSISADEEQDSLKQTSSTCFFALPTGRRVEESGRGEDGEVQRLGGKEIEEVGDEKEENKLENRDNFKGQISGSVVDVSSSLTSARTRSEGYHSGRSKTSNFNGPGRAGNSLTYTIPLTDASPLIDANQLIDTNQLIDADRLIDGAVPWSEADGEIYFPEDADGDFLSESLCSTSIDGSWDTEEENDEEVATVLDVGSSLGLVRQNISGLRDMDVNSEFLPLPDSLVPSTKLSQEVERFSLSVALSTQSKPDRWTDAPSKRELCLWIIHRWHFWPISAVFDQWKEFCSRRKRERHLEEAMKMARRISVVKVVFLEWRMNTLNLVDVHHKRNIDIQRRSFIKWFNHCSRMRFRDAQLLAFRERGEKSALMTAFSFWRKSAAESRMKSAVLIQRKKAVTEVARKYAELWRRKVQYCAELSITLAEHEKELTNGSLTLSFSNWRRQTFVLAESKRRWMERSWRAWRQICDAKKREKLTVASFRETSMKKGSLAVWRRRLTLKRSENERIREHSRLCLSAWISFVRNEKRRQNAFLLFQRFSRLRSLRVHLFSWQNSFRNLEMASKSSDVKTASFVFRFWVGWSEERRICRRMVKGWKEFCDLRKVERQRIELLDNKVKLGYMKEIFLLWRSHSRTIANARQTRQRLQSKEVLFNWKSYCEDKKSEKANWLLCLAERDSSLLRRSFSSLRSSFNASLSVRRFRQTKERALLSSVFEALKLNRLESLEEKRETENVLRIHFQVWRDSTLAAKSEEEQLVMMCQLQSESALLQNYFSRWNFLSSIIENRKEERHKRLLAIVMREWRQLAKEQKGQILLLRIFKTWKWESKRLKEETASLAQDFHTSHQSKMASSLFQQWRNHFANVGLARDHFSNVALRQSMTLWSNRHKSMMRDDELASSWTREQMTHSFWRLWRTRWIRRKVEKRLEGKHRSEALRRIFLAWKTLKETGQVSRKSSSSPIIISRAPSVKTPAKDISLVFVGLPPLITPEMLPDFDKSSSRDEAKGSPSVKSTPPKLRPSKIPSVKIKGLSPYGKKILNMGSSSESDEEKKHLRLTSEILFKEVCVESIAKSIPIAPISYTSTMTSPLTNPRVSTTLSTFNHERREADASNVNRFPSPPPPECSHSTSDSLQARRKLSYDAPTLSSNTKIYAYSSASTSVAPTSLNGSFRSRVSAQQTFSPAPSLSPAFSLPPPPSLLTAPSFLPTPSLSSSSQVSTQDLPPPPFPSHSLPLSIHTSSRLSHYPPSLPSPPALQSFSSPHVDVSELEKLAINSPSSVDTVELRLEEGFLPNFLALP